MQKDNQKPDEEEPTRPGWWALWWERATGETEVREVLAVNGRLMMRAWWTDEPKSTYWPLAGWDGPFAFRESGAPHEL